MHRVHYYGVIMSAKVSQITSLTTKWNCWSLRYSWSVTCWRCPNYIFILALTPGFNRLAKTTARRDERHLSFGICCALYQAFDGIFVRFELWPHKTFVKYFQGQKKNFDLLYMDKIFCVEFQRVSLKFHTKYLTHTLKDTFFFNSTRQI